MGTTNLKELLAEFKTIFNEDSWLQTEDQKRVLASVKRVLSSKKSAQEQCQSLLKILYQCQQQNIADNEQTHQLILGVLTIWLIQEKPDRIKVQAVISDLLNSSLVKGKKNDAKLIQIIKDLIVIGAQIAYYRDEGICVLALDPENDLSDPENESEKKLLQSRKTQLRFFLNNVSEIITKTQSVPHGTDQKGRRVLAPDPEEISSILEKTLEEIEQSQDNEILAHLPAQVLFQNFFSSATYNAEEFERYQTFIKDWLANKVDKDQADEILLIHILRSGIEQISKERESTGWGLLEQQGYKVFSTHAQKFIEFLTEIHQQYGLPNEPKLQELKEEIAIRQARLLGSALASYEQVFSLAEKLLAIANHCIVPSERRDEFYNRLFEVGVEKCSFVKYSFSTIGNFSEYSSWGMGYWYRDADYYGEIPNKAGILKIFWNGFLLKFIQRYREKELKKFIAQKNYSALWIFCENLTKLTYVLPTRWRLNLNIEFFHGVREELSCTMKYGQMSLNSIDDFIQYIQAAIATKSTLLSNQCKEWDSLDKNGNLVWEKSNARRTERFALLTLDEQQLNKWLKTLADYKKILKTLVVDLPPLILEGLFYNDFAAKQVNVLRRINAEITRSALYELKKEYPTAVYFGTHFSEDSKILYNKAIKQLIRFPIKDYYQFAEFIFSGNEIASDLSKDLASKLTSSEHIALVQYLIGYKEAPNKPNKNLEKFLLDTLEVAVNKITSQAESEAWFNLQEHIEKSFKFSSVEKQIQFRDLAKLNIVKCLQGHLLSMGKLHREIMALSIPMQVEIDLKRLENLGNEEYLTLIRKYRLHQENLAKHKTTYAQQVQPFRNAYQNFKVMDLSELYALVKGSEKMANNFNEIKKNHEELLRDSSNEVNKQETEFKVKYAALCTKFDQFLLAKPHEQKDAEGKTESERRIDLEIRRKTIYDLISAIESRDKPQSKVMRKRIDQTFESLNRALQQKSAALDTPQKNITRLMDEYQLLQTQPDIAFKTLSDKLAKLEQAITSAEEAVEELPAEFKTAEEALDQAEAWVKEVKKQEELHQKNFEAIQKQGEELLLRIEQELHKDSDRFEDYQKQTAKFRFEKLSVLDEPSRAAFLSSEQRLVTVFTAIEPRLFDWTKQCQAERSGFQTKHQQRSATLLDSKLSLMERETVIKQFGFEKNQVDQKVKGFAPQIIEIETRLNEAQTELATQSEHIIRTFDEQIKARTLKAQVLENEIATQLAEEKRLNDAVKDNWQRDTWLIHQLKKLDCITPIVLPDGAIDAVALGDLVTRKDAVNQMMQTAETIREDAEHDLPIILKAVQNFVKAVVPKLSTYRKRLQNISEQKYIPSILANAVLTIFNHGFLSQLPFIAPLKHFIEEQKKLTDYTNHLVQIETQFEQMRILNNPLSIETQQKVQNLNNQLAAHQAYVQEQKHTFLTAASKDIIEDELAKALVTSVDADTTILKRDLSHWLILGANDLSMSTQELITRLSDVQIQYSRYHQMEATLEKGHQEKTCLNKLTISIEKITQAKAQHEQTLRQMQTELTALITEKQRFTDEAEVDRYQAKLKAYQQKAEQGLLPFHLLLQDSELSSQKKEKLFNDLIQSYPNCVNQLDEKKQTPLQIAIKLGDIQWTERLLKVGANCNVQDVKSNTPLHDAVKQRNLEIVKLLLTHGANPNIQNAQNKTAFNDQASKNALLHLAAQAGDLELVEQFINLGANIHSRGSQKETALHGAVKGGHKSIVRKLLRKGANPNRQNTQGNTPLHLALSLGHTRIAKRLLRVKNLNINLVNNCKETLLHVAIEHQQPVMGQLLAKGVDINAQTLQGETALSLAVNQGNVNLVKWLFLKGARLDIRNPAGATAFNTAKGRMLFKQLVPSTEKLNLADKKRILSQGGGYDLLYLAIEEGNTRLLQWLVDAQGVDINVYEGEGRTLLNLLSQPSYFPALSQDCDPKEAEQLLGIPASHEDLKMQDLRIKNKRQVYLEYLIERGAKFWKAQDKAGNHLLHLLMMQGFHDELVKDLVDRLGFFKKDWVLNALNSEGETLLHLAIKQGNIELVALLVEKGARLDITNRQGEKPFDTKAGMAMYLILKGEVIQDQQLPWFKRLKKWMEGRDYSRLLDKIEAEQQSSETSQKAQLEKTQSSVFEEEQNEETLFIEKLSNTNPFVTQKVFNQESIIEDRNKASWFDEVDQAVKETYFFEEPMILTNPFETTSTNLFAEINLAKNSEKNPELKDLLNPHSQNPVKVESAPASLSSSLSIYPSIFKHPITPKAPKKSAVKPMPAELAIGDVFDQALNQGQYESAKQLLKGNRGYQGNLSFQNLPKVIKRYLLLNNKDLQKENTLKRAKKSLRLEEAYIEKHEALYQAVMDSDSAFVAAWFEAQAKHIAKVEARVQKGEKGAKEALTLLNSQLFEVINVQRDGMTILTLLIEREKARQLHAASENESEATANALRRYHDGAILRILMAYIPKSVVLPNIVEDLALYDLVELPEFKQAKLDKSETEEDIDLAYAEEDPMKYANRLPGWLDDAQKLFNEVTGVLGKTFNEATEKFIQTHQQVKSQVSQTVLGQKDLIEVYAYHRPTVPSTQTLAAEHFDLYLMASEKAPIREELDQLFNLVENPKLPMLIRHQNYLWFYGQTPSGTTLLEPLPYEKHPKLYDEILPEQSIDDQELKKLSKEQIPSELYEAIGSIKGHIHGMLPAEERLKQGKALAEKMSSWIEKEMGKNFKGADIFDARDKEGNTLLHLAVQDNLDVVIEWLLPSSLTQDLKNWGERTLADVKEKLVSAGASGTGSVLGIVASAAVGTVVTGATLPLLGPFSIAAGVLAGKLTALFVESGSQFVIEKMYGVAQEKILLSLEQRIEVRHQNHAGDTALHIAARTTVENNLWIVSALLAKSKSEDLNIINQKGDTPLHLAIKHRNAHIVALLILAGANPNITNAQGKTALHLAATSGDETLFQMLIESGVNIFTQTQLGQTVEQLLTKKISLLENQMRKETNQPERLIQLADEKARYERMQNSLYKNKSLWQKAKDFHDEHQMKDTEEQKEAWWDKAQDASRQRAEKAVEADARGNTLLHVLVQNKANYELVKDLLLHYEVKDLNRPNHEGNTLLHLAVLHGGGTGTNAKMIRLLLAHGANRYATNHEGKMPIELVPDEHYQYKIDEVFDQSLSKTQKKDQSNTKFFKPKTSPSLGQQFLDIPNKTKKCNLFG